MMLYFLPSVAYAQTDVPAWRVTATIAPLLVWRDEVNHSDFGFELVLNACRHRDLPLPWGVGARLVGRNTDGEWLQEWGGFVGTEIDLLGLLSSINVGYFTVERRSCPGCREDRDEGIDLSLGYPSIRMRLGTLTGVVSGWTRVTFGDGLGYYSGLGFGLSLPRQN